jgi:hypothetical protein
MGAASAAARSRRIAEGHFASEASNDTDVIMRTMVSGDFMATAVLENPPEGRRLVFCHDEAEQRAHYNDIRNRILVRGAEMFTSIGGGFYCFLHGIVDVEIVATGEIKPNEAIAVMPVSADEDAIMGEIGGSYPSDGKTGDGPRDPAVGRLSVARLHARWLDALRAGDANAVAECYDTTATAAATLPGDRRLHSLIGRDGVRHHYRALFDAFGVEDIEVVMRVVDRWFAFAELAWMLRDRDGARFHYRTANALVLSNADTAIVDLGYGAPLVPA